MQFGIAFRLNPNRSLRMLSTRRVCSLTFTPRPSIATYSLQPLSVTSIHKCSIIHTLPYSLRRRKTILKRVVFHSSSSLSSPNPSLRFHRHPKYYQHHHMFERFRVDQTEHHKMPRVGLYHVSFYYHYYPSHKV